MIKTDNDILYNRIKNVVGFYRSDKFKKWFHEQFPGLQQHHCFGSFSQSIKTSDYCSIPVNEEMHKEAEKDKSNFAIEHLPNLINILQMYIHYLENKK